MANDNTSSMAPPLPTVKDGEGARHSVELAAAVSLRQLLLLNAVARLGGIGRAADACGLTQPAATQSLAALAGRCGFAVLSRSARGVALTPSGRELHARVGLLLDRLDRTLVRVGVLDSAEAAWRITHAQLRLVNAIEERGTLDRALRVLDMDTRAARRCLRLMEALLDQPVLRQDGSGTLNETGRLIARHVGRLPDEVLRTVLSVRDDAGRASRTFVVGVAPDPGLASLNGLVRRFIRSHPDWCLEVLEAGQDDLLARLAIGEVNLVVGHQPEDKGDLFDWEDIARMGYRVVGRRGHPLAGGPAVPVDALRRFGWIFGARGSQRRLASDLLFAGGVPPRCVLVTSAPPMMAQLLPEDDLLCLMSDGELAARADLLTAMPCQTPEAVARLGIARRIDAPASPIHAEIVEGLRVQYGPDRSAG